MSNAMSNLSNFLSKMSLKRVNEQPNETFAHSAPRFERSNTRKKSLYRPTREAKHVKRVTYDALFK